MTSHDPTPLAQAGTSDLVAFVEMLDRAGIVYECREFKDGHGKLATTSVTITQGDGEKNIGYGGFVAGLDFDRDGALTTAGAWE